MSDLEALTRDPATGHFWAAFENRNQILKFDEAEKLLASIRPAAMRDWSYNSGPEAMTRLADGQFLVLSEGRTGWFSGEHRGVLFDADPTAGGEAKTFTVPFPGGLRPVDMALLPNGQVIILLRKAHLGFPPNFVSGLVVADPRSIRSGEAWDTGPLIPLAGVVPPENYEGIAAVQGEDGSTVLWLISDDNLSYFQRTLLIKLRWQPKEKARENPARSSR